ncbi:MAG: hypothetical protein KBD46_02090 [Candidatus Levybacteria bacterium]|nr:hypothetical protein [Candidatus Levybacteria bacterium]
MKKKNHITTLVLFVLCVLLVLFPRVSFAQETEMAGEMVIVSPPPIVTITPIPSYLMPYPGILPDNPLYGLKTLRDKFVSTMIGDPLKKVEFNLLQADKRIGAALFLIKTGNQDKQELALSTISKGQNYYEEAIVKLSEAKKQGTNVTEMISTMKRAGEQHIYQLEKAKKTLPKTLQPTMGELIARSQKLHTTVKTLK